MRFGQVFGAANQGLFDWPVGGSKSKNNREYVNTARIREQKHE